MALQGQRTSEEHWLWRIAPRMLLAAGLVLLSAEALFRQICYVPRVHDPDFGYVPQAGRTARWAIEGNGAGHYHARGARSTGRDQQPQRPAIVVIGDSYTEALHVDDDQTFTAQAEALINAAGLPARLLNVGVAGGRTPGYIQQAPRYREVFKPAWSVVVLNENDLQADMFDRSATYFQRSAPGLPTTLRLQIVPSDSGGSRWRGLWRRAKAQSALLQRAGLQLVGFLGDAQATRLFRAAEDVPRAAPQPAPEYPVYEALTLLRAAYGDRLTLVLLPAFASTPSAAARALSPVEREFQRFCAAEALSCVHLGAAWTALSARRMVPYGFPNRGFNTGHLNLTGHAAVAEALARELLMVRSHGLL